MTAGEKTFEMKEGEVFKMPPGTDHTFIATGGPALVFIDMPSGSCLFAAMRQLQTMSGVRVVTGVNLAMLLEFVFHREGAVDDVAAHVAEVGARAVAAR